MNRVSQQHIDSFFGSYLWATEERIERDLALGEITNACTLGHQKVGDYHTACDGWIYERGRPSTPTCACACHKEPPRKRRHWEQYPTIERVLAMFRERPLLLIHRREAVMATRKKRVTPYLKVERK